MLKNNLILAFRLLIRQRIYSSINLIGLSLGMTSFLIIVLFYQYQLSYDQSFNKKDRIFRINRFMKERDEAGYFSKISACAGASLKDKITGVEHVVRVSYLQTELTYNEKTFDEKSLWAADEDFFELFDFEFVAGDPKSALVETNSIVLSETMARKYFGNEPPLSKVISTIGKEGDIIDIKVTGVIKDVPPNTHLIIDGLLPFSSQKNYKEMESEYEDWFHSHTYLLLEESADVANVEKLVNEILLSQVPTVGFEHARFPLMKITDIFFNSSKDGGAQRGSKLLTNILLLIGIFILLIASLNYVNLSTARSLKRAREVGIRKVSGASKKQLVLQYMGESVVFCLFAMLLALFVVNLIIPYINNFSNIAYRIDLNRYFMQDPQFVAIALTVCVITGLLSGLYPAMIISSFNPARSLKGENPVKGRISTKKTLVVAQYVVSVFLVVCCIAIYKVFDHIKNQDFGFDKENVVALRIDKINDPAKTHQLRQELRSIEGVQGLAATSKIPLTHRDSYPIYIYDDKTDYKYNHPVIYIDDQYFELLGLKILEKASNFHDDTYKQNGVFVNNLFLERYGYKYALGNSIEVYHDADQNKIDFSAPIIGIVSDMKNRVLSPQKGPIIFKYGDTQFRYFLIKLAPERQHETIAALEAVYKEHHPYLSCNITFIDDEVNLMFNIISPFSKLVYYATFFAILIASMGLFAMALFITQQRTKEVGIRKIFGSSELSVSILLARQYIKLILVSFLISGPVTFYGFKSIFNLFPEKLVMSWWWLAAVGGGLMLIAIITVFGQSWKVARSNPVDTLRYE